MAGYVLVFFSFALAASVAAWLVAPSEEAALIRLRARELRFAGRPPATVEEDGLSQPMLQRLFGPSVTRLQHVLLRLTPHGLRDQLRAKLREAGDPLSPGSFLAIRLYAGILASVLMGLSMGPRLAGRGGWPAALAFFALAAYLGSALPSFWVGRLASQRKQVIRRSLPEVLDLLCVSIEAGLGLEGAIQKVAERYDGPLARELAYSLKEINLGKPREDAWRSLAQRVNLPDVNAVVSAIVQAERLGASVSTVLRVQTQDLRERRRQRAEEHARQVPIKLLFPLVLFVFPAVFVIILGPAAIQLISVLSGQLG